MAMDQRLIDPLIVTIVYLLIGFGLNFYAPALRYWGRTMCVAFILTFAGYFYLYFRRIHLFADFADRLDINVTILFLGQTVVISAVAVFFIMLGMGFGRLLEFIGDKLLSKR